MAFSWNSLPKPIIGLSAMDGVTDAAMREITKEVGGPDFMVTEFTSADGIVHGVAKLLRDFYYTLKQRPIIAQIFGTNPETFYKTAIICAYLGFDGIDINMGCPADSIAKKGGGACLIQTPELAQKLIRAVQTGIADWANGKSINDLGLPPTFVELLKLRAPNLQSLTPNLLPVSVKTRIGFDKPDTANWLPSLLETHPAVITLHGRTLEQQYSGKANWEEIAKAVEIAKGSGTLIFGNGDLTSQEVIHQRISESGVDGVWVARAAMGNPWIFTNHSPTTQERFAVAIKHCEIFEEFNRTVFASDPYPFLNMRKHLGWYVKDFPDAALIRAKLFQTNNSVEVKQVLAEVL
ncbi:MAG TPA: tRNA-dihydrouridine synthase [Patescibacteria group bacterium]|nr:tRNA-dihydrouridine synthase [Patescibacteria group bacterium]